MAVVTVEHSPTWSVQPNDLIGGWIVTTYPFPLSEHDTRKDGNPKNRGVIACECNDRAYAVLIMGLLNGHTCFRSTHRDRS